MTFRNILVHIDDSKQCAARLALAIGLSRECQAHLTGLYVITHPQYPGPHQVLQRRVAQAEEQFRLQTAEAGVSAEWIAADWTTVGVGMVGVGMVEVINHCAFAKDLVIVGQSDPELQETDAPADLPERVITGSGRPVLVVPFAGNFQSVGHRVVIAWKACRESARAVYDSMPFLQAAGQVSVVTIEPSWERPAEKDPLSDICASLERHDIRPTQETLMTCKIPVATLLMEYAWENGCDLMVMGVPRSAQNIGPVARQILDQMTVPMLMSY